MGENQCYRWVTHGRYSCEDCEALDGKEMTLADWRSSVLPGIHPGCDCSLEPVEEEPGEEKTTITPIKVQQTSHGALKTGITKQITVSYGALKPVVSKVKAVKPSNHNRPTNHKR